MVDLAPERVTSHSRDSGEGKIRSCKFVVVMESWWWFRGFFAPGAEENRKATALSATNKKCTLPAPNSIEFGAGRVYFGTEREPTDAKTKIVKHFPFF